MSAKGTHISTSQLVRLTGASRQQLHRWVQAGLIPQPHNAVGASGRGRRGLWPASVVETIQQIRKASGRGVPLAKVADQMRAAGTERVSAQQAAAASAKEVFQEWSRPGSLGGVDYVVIDNRQRTPTDYRVLDAIREVVKAHLMVLQLRQSACTRLAANAIAPEVLEAAVFMELMGLQSVLVFDPKASRVMAIPDFAVAFFHSDTLIQMWRRRESFDWPLRAGCVTLRVEIVLAQVEQVFGRKLFTPKDRENVSGRTYVPSLSVTEIDTQHNTILRYPVSASTVTGDTRALGFTIHYDLGVPELQFRHEFAASMAAAGKGRFASGSKRQERPAAATRKNARAEKSRG